jgi:flagellar motility protein MotE (MotC chaperone)
LLSRIYKGVAVLAIIHMALFAGLLGVGAAKGMFTADRVKAVVAAIHPTPSPSPTPVAGEPTPAPGASPKPEAEHAAPVNPSASSEIARRNLERQMLETSHQLVLANREMVEVTRRREELERREKELREARVEATQNETRETFAKDVEVLGMMKPKIALDNLLSRPDDEAAQLLFALEARKCKAILEAASKDPAKWTRMLAVQQKMRDQAAPNEPVQPSEAAGAADSSSPAPSAAPKEKSP